MTAAPLYHFTCSHGRDAIDAGGFLRPQGQLFPLLWLTDLETPYRDALGLTSRILDCDRTEHRYIVEHPTPTVSRWVDVRRTLPRDYVASLESTPCAMPMHWYVATGPQIGRLT